MNEALFLEEVDQWLADARRECARLYTLGVPAEQILGIATAIANGLAVKRAIGRQQLSGPMAAPFRTIRQ